MLRTGKTGRLVAIALAVAMLGVVSMTGCSSSDDIPAELIAMWQLQGFILDNGTTTPVDDPAKYTIDLQSDSNANIVSDCNRCSGSYFVDGSELRFGLLACTLAACLPGSFDGQFQLALSTVSSWEIVDGSLFLNYDGGELRLTPAPALF